MGGGGRPATWEQPGRPATRQCCSPLLAAIMSLARFLIMGRKHYSEPLVTVVRLNGVLAPPTGRGPAAGRIINEASPGHAGGHGTSAVPLCLVPLKPLPPTTIHCSIPPSAPA